jgi:hypothetical protein
MGVVIMMLHTNWCVRVFIISKGTPNNDVILYHYAMTPQVGVPLSLVYGP